MDLIIFFKICHILPFRFSDRILKDYISMEWLRSYFPTRHHVYCGISTVRGHCNIRCKASHNRQACHAEKFLEHPTVLRWHYSFTNGCGYLSTEQSYHGVCDSFELQMFFTQSFKVCMYVLCQLTLFSHFSYHTKLN